MSQARTNCSPLHFLVVFSCCSRSRFALLVVAASASTAASFSLTAAGSPVLRSPAAAAARIEQPVRCAYNPQPSKYRPKKSKTPKEKVKAPAPTAAIVPEQTFFEGAPSITETLIPGLSLFTVVGVIPFTASLARQAWTKYKFTNRRIEVASGFQGKDKVQVLWREITDVRWLRRYGGAAGDLVFSLQDGSKLEMRSVPDFDRNLNFIMAQVPEDALDASDYPDGPAKEFIAKVESGEEAPAVLGPYDPEAEAAKSEA